MSVERMPENQNSVDSSPDTVNGEFPRRGDPPDWPKPDIPAMPGPNFSESSSSSGSISGFLESDSGGGNATLF